MCPARNWWQGVNIVKPNNRIVVAAMGEGWMCLLWITIFCKNKSKMIKCSCRYRPVVKGYRSWRWYKTEEYWDMVFIWISWGKTWRLCLPTSWMRHHFNKQILENVQNNEEIRLEITKSWHGSTASTSLWENPQKCMDFCFCPLQILYVTV